MTATQDIILGIGKAGPAANAAADAALPERHWRRWRLSGVAISAVFHGCLALVLVATLPQFGAEAHKDIGREKEPLPVEIVARAPEPEPPKKEPEPEKPQAALPAPKVEPPIPDPPKAIPEPKAEAEKPLPPPPKSAPSPRAAAPPPNAPAPKPPLQAATPPQPASPAAPTSPAEPPAAPERPDIAWTLPAPPAPPRDEPPGDLGPAPRAAPAPGEGLKLEADVVALPDKKETDKHAQYWVLEPLRVDLRNGCGISTISGAMALTERISEGVYRGSVQTTTRSQRCGPQSSLYTVEVRFDRNEVTMTGAGGFFDRGVWRNGVMMLEDSFGRSIWRKR